MSEPVNSYRRYSPRPADQATGRPNFSESAQQKGSIVPPNETTHRQRGRPQKAVLSAERIVDAAIHIVSTTGGEHLTMGRLAHELDVATSSLYNHAPSKRHVLIQVQDRINRQIDCSGFDSGPWDEALERWAWSYRNVYAQHTPLIPTMAVLPVADAPYTLQMYEKVAEGLANAGWDHRRIIKIIVGIESLVFGAAFDAEAPANLFHPGDLTHLAPVFSEIIQHRPEDARQAADEAFDWALTGMLSGFRTHLTAQ